MDPLDSKDRIHNTGKLGTFLLIRGLRMRPILRLRAKEISATDLVVILGKFLAIINKL